MTTPHWMLPGVLAPLRKPRVRWLADDMNRLPMDVPQDLVDASFPQGPVPTTALAPHPTGYSVATPIMNPDTSLALADVSLSARMTAAGTVQSYQTQMCYPKLQQDFMGLLAGSPGYAAGFAAGQAVFEASETDKHGLRSNLPSQGQLGYAGQQRDATMSIKWITETPGTVGTVFSYAPASRTPIFKPSASPPRVPPKPYIPLPACPPGFQRVGNDCAKMYPCSAGWEYTAQSPTQCVKVTCPDDRRYDAKHGCVPVICPAKQVWSNKANKCVVVDYVNTDSFLKLLSGTPNQVGAAPTSRVRWLGEAPGRLGADTFSGEPNFKSPIALSAWDFTKCTYVLQPGDTIDGLAQTYLGCKAGDFVAGSGRCISLINNANLNTPGYNGNANQILYAGNTINMPPAACQFAKDEYTRQKAACVARSGFTWDDNIRACNPSTGTPIPQCFPCQSSAACPLIQRGDVGDAVLQWNQILVRDAAISGATFTPDNGFGDLTYTATVAWQTAKGLDADGVVGPLTWGQACCPVGQVRNSNTGVCEAPPQCSETTACPPATYCLSGNCVKPPFPAPCPADLDNVNGTCRAKCPKGKVRDKKDPTKCIQAVSTAGSGGDAGVLVLALGALGALALTFMGKDKGAGGMASNPHRASHYARRTPASRRVVRASW